MRKIGVLSLAALLLLSLAAAAPQASSNYDKLKADAEREVVEKSFRRAHELYEQAAKLELPPAERRWVTFRLADTELRAQAAGGEGDDAARQAAHDALQNIIEKTEHDDVWAYANETLGAIDGATQYSQAALDYWAGSSELARARGEYLRIVWTLVGDDNQPWNVSREVLVNAVQLAQTPEERVRARYILARYYFSQGNPADIERGVELLEEIAAMSERTDLYDDALYLLATTLSQQDEGANYTRALEIYRRILREFPPGQSQYRDEAQRGIDVILQPSVSAYVPGTFLPESEQQIYLVWRNVAKIDLSLTAVDLTKDARMDPSGPWMQNIRTAGRTVVRRWTYDTNDSGEHLPGRTDLRLEPRLTPGAYVLTASAGKITARQLILVSDAHILVHTGGTRVDVFVSDVNTGEPIANARVHLSQAMARDQVMEQDAQTDVNGLARIVRSNANGQMLITATAGARQAYHSTYSYWYGGRHDQDAWQIYAFTDRPAYRPGETVQWKMFARVRENEQWTTPRNAELEYQITGPRGDKVATGKAKLTDFGSFWGELPLTDTMALGVYTIQFKAPGPNGEQRGSAQLFRLEEYKLPEFQVQVTTPEGKQYRLGETIEAAIDATYYFGGPVANATVEAVVYQEPFYRYWYPWRRYDWYYDVRPQYGSGTIVSRQTLETDATGRALLRIDTPRDGIDSSYRIEARVVDASRREVRGEGTVRVTRQRYSVMAQPEHLVHRPGDSVSVDFKAMDANDKPVQTTGTVKVFRRQWKKRYQDEEVLTTKLTTDAKGETTLTFTPRGSGYYVVRWTSEDGPRARDVVTTETAVWVAEKNTMDVGYHAGGLDIIVDKDTLRAGDAASLILVTPSSGRWVLLTSAADDILDTQVVHLDGTVKLMQLPTDQRHVPNFFVTASSVFDRALSTDTERIVVPPVEQFLTVDVKSDREQYEPRETGTVTVTTRDANGKPVAAEVALSVSDEAVTAIQEDLAGDPRKVFYGSLRGNPVNASGGLQSQQYLKIDEKSADEEGTEEDERRGYRDGIAKRARVGGVMGGVVAQNAAMAPPPPAPPPPMAMPAPVAEAITVTAAADKAVAEQGIDVQVRSDFRSTAFWKPDVVTDANGTATVKVQYPEALTTWRATARAASAGSQFGMSSSTAKTTMPVLVRLQGPRFFVVGDRVVVSAVINNNTDAAVSVNATLQAKGLSGGTEVVPVQVPAHGEGRADWTVTAQNAGPATLSVTARNAQYGDAMERTFTVYEHGIDKLVARSGKMRGDEAIIHLDLPRERRATDLTVQVAPSIAVTMLDALPYLIDYPYGCTEQTMSRFLPAAVVARTVEKLGLGRARIAGKDLDAVTRAGMRRLFDMQHGSGAWGWWKEGSDDSWMTAYVVWGFAVARDAALPFDQDRVERAAVWLDEHLVDFERDPNQQAWLLHALGAWRRSATPNGTRAFDNVYRNREKLTSYSRALLALTAHRWGKSAEARVLVRNLEDGVQIDKTPDQSVLLPGDTAAETMQTAHWGSANRFWWRWYEGPVETTSFVLQALVNIDPQNRLIEPAMNWLVKNRRGTRWNNTRDTAIALLSINDYLQKSGELAGDVSYEVTVNDKVIATKTLSAKDVLGAPSRFPVEPSLLRDAQQQIRIRRTSGKSPLYFSAEARFVSLEEPIHAAGNEIFVRREYFRLAARPTLLKGVLFDRVPLRDQESIVSGERLEVVVTIDAKNDYDYLLFEDLKPGGFEAVELQSGQPLYANSPKGGSTWVYQELRDRKVAMFIDHLPQGIWEIRYALRAEVPGTFHALPLLGQAMYVPDVRANGEEVRVTVRERE